MDPWTYRLGAESTGWILGLIGWVLELIGWTFGLIGWILELKVGSLNVGLDP